MKAFLHSVIGGLALTLISSWACASCLDEAARFAERICGEIKTGGSSQLVSGSGELTVEAKGIIARLFGAARSDAKVEAATSSYENVARQELAKRLSERQGCAERMVTVATAQVCNKQPETKIVCEGESEGNCPGPRHDLFFTCGYFGTDKEIADNICEGARHRRLKTVSGGHCGYSLIEVTCP
jgi:hypothetical protein